MSSRPSNQAKKKTDEWIHEQIAYYLKVKGVSPELKYWKEHTEKDSETGTSLNNLFQLASTREFFRHKKWSIYLHKHHGCDTKELLVTTKQRIWTDEKIHARMKKGLEAGLRTQAEWKKHPVFIHDFYRAKNRTVNGTVFFGEGGLSSYLKKYHKEYA